MGNSGGGRDGIRIFAWACIVVGVFIIAGSSDYAAWQSRQQAAAWFDSESRKASLESHERAVVRLNRAIDMMDRGVVPAHTVMSPWPVVGVGGGIVAFGVLLLAIRRPQRTSN